MQNQDEIAFGDELFLDENKSKETPKNGAPQKIKNFKVNLEAKILSSKKVIIVPHLNADFDAIGSAIGLTFIVKKLKKVPTILIDDPYQTLDPGVQKIIGDVKQDISIVNCDSYLKNKDENDLFILTDVNKSNLIPLQQELLDKDRTIIIDHHGTNEKTIEATDTYISPTVSSASEIIAKLLLCLFKAKISSQMANYLLAGIYLDTNKLSKNVSSDTMAVASKLIKRGATIDYVTSLFSEDFASDRRVQNLVGKVQMFNYTIAITTGDEKEIYSSIELAKAADYLLKFGVAGAFAIGNIDENTISVSARSKAEIHVGEVMQQLEGGGNQFSGATKIVNSTPDEVSKKLMKILIPKYYVK